MLKYTFKSFDGAGHHLVEDVVGTLKGLLGDDTGLLKQICNVTNNVVNTQVQLVAWKQETLYKK